jgi:hypothetical protein
MVPLAHTPQGVALLGTHHRPFMSATVSANMTRAELRLRVAERAKFVTQSAQGTVTPSVTQPAADKLDRALADGIRLFMREHAWRFAMQWITLAVGAAGTLGSQVIGSASRYRLPAGVQVVPHPPVFYARAGARSRRLMMEPMGTLIQRELQNLSVGQPCAVAFEYRSLWTDAPGMEPGIEMRLWPAPSEPASVVLQATLSPRLPVDDAQVGGWPAVHDLTIVDAAVVCLFESDRTPDSPHALGARAYYAAKLAKSIERDLMDHQQAVRGSVETSELDAGSPRSSVLNVDGSVLIGN